MSARRILVLHGPNLNLLHGARSLEAIDAALFARAVALGVELKTVQSNWEGGLLDTLAAEREWFEALIVNPAALAPSAVALAEAISFLRKPAIEVQLDEVKKGKSALKGVVQKQIAGKGPEGYLEALVALAPKGASKAPQVEVLARPAAKPASKAAQVEVLARPAAKPAVLEVKKTLGARKPALNKRPPAVAAKSMGGKKTVAAGVLSRALVRQQIADRLSGALTPSGLAAWARAEWQKLQSGAPIESGQRDTLEDVLQQLLLSATMKASDDQLIELMTQLSE